MENSKNIMEEKMLENALKLYNTGKEHYKKDEVLSKKCLMQSLDTLNKLSISKNKNLAKYKELINTTEVDCQRMLNNKQSINIFTLISVNDIESIRNLQNINFREINANGNTILHHAIDIGDMGIIKELLKRGGMIDNVNGNGNTLLEYACLKKDPNIINFLVMHGADIKKHLFFRKNNNYYLNKSDIDMAILLKIILKNSMEKTNYDKFTFLEQYFNTSELIGINSFTIKDLMIGLNHMFNNKESYETYKVIIIEELNMYEINKGINICIYNKIDIILSNLVPFINYPFNMSSIFLIKNEIKYLIKYILSNEKKDYKNILLSKLFEIYIQPGLFTEDYIGIIVYNILSKIKL